MQLFAEKNPPPLLLLRIYFNLKANFTEREAETERMSPIYWPTP